MYNDTVMDYFTNPRNVGEIEDASGVGTVGNAKCGDIMRIFIKVEDNIITDVKFKTFGCGAAIATSSRATEMVKGKTIEKRWHLPTRTLPTLWADCQRSSCTAPCWPRRRCTQLYRTITTSTT